MKATISRATRLVLACFLFMSCTAGAFTYVLDPLSIEELEDLIAQATARIEVLKQKEEIASTDPTDVSDLTTLGVVTIPDKSEYSFNSTKINPKCESIDLKPGGSSSWTEVQSDNNTYVQVWLNYKNLRTAPIEVSKVLTGKLICDEKYSYENNTVNIANGNSLNWGSIQPLGDDHIVIAVEAPKAVVEAAYSLVMHFTLDGTQYTVPIRQTEPELPPADNEIAADHPITIEDTGLAEYEWAHLTNQMVPHAKKNYYYQDVSNENLVFVDACIRFTSHLKEEKGVFECGFTGNIVCDGVSYIASLGPELYEDTRIMTNIYNFKPQVPTYLHIYAEVPRDLAYKAKDIHAELKTEKGTFIINIEKYKTITPKSKGDDVKLLQEALIALGYLSGKADGDYGNKTKAAVEQFQKDHGLKETGTADSKTIEKIIG